MNEILSREELTPYLLRLKIASPHIAKRAQVGQLVIVIVDEIGERIPLTLAGWDKEEGNISLAVSQVGKTTHKLGRLKVGDRLAHVVGPLGHPSHIGHVGTVTIVALGYAILTMLPLARALKGAGNQLVSARLNFC